ncbi:lipopolysaccharide biosynthesis protein [Micromonospora yasonensis]|uniref:lipopolysaccharide biosynthesis protein n=1 Tax=Micromonospora yasonensis TaxID=1128667 RepID=UPI00222E3A06|nr:lipopolysaccharide biosynthesis protein [Micromonospora yasonensis]MCW3839601.1 lipopolysaccharide biosynthesis protein [Micromonospora yasonensis]
MGGILTGAVSRGLAGLVPLALIPVTLGYLGPDLYGLWMTVTAVVGMAAFADLGLGNGLMTKLAPCYATGDVATARRYISNAYLSLSLLALALIGVLWSCATVVPWARIFHTTGSVTPDDARRITLVCLTAFVVNVPLSLITRVQMAYQQISSANLWQGGGNLVALPLAMAAVLAGLSPVLVVAGTVVGPPAVNLVNNLWFFRRRRPDLRPGLTAVDATVAVELFRLGGLFFALTVITGIATNVDLLIVTQARGLHEAADYAVPLRLFAQLGFVLALINAPLWPANGEALAQGHLAWVRRMTRRMTLVSAGLALGLGALLTVVANVAPTLLGSAFTPDDTLLVGLVVWWLLLGVIAPRFMVQNAAGVVRPQLLGWSVYLLVTLPAKWYGVRHFGAQSVPWIGVAVYLVTVLPAALYGFRSVLVRHTDPRSQPASGRPVAAPVVS